MVDDMNGSGDEIILDAGPDADADDDIGRLPKQINHVYLQKTIKGIKRLLVIFDDRYLNYSLKNSNPVVFKLKFFKDKDVEKKGINLTYIGLEPEMWVHVAWKWLYAGLGTVTLAAVLIYIGEYSGFSFARKEMLPVGILLGVFGIIAMMIFYYKTQRKVIYKSCTGEVPLFELFHMPRKKEYRYFIDVLEQKIQKAHHREGVSMKYRLVGELKYLRKMSELGLIANSDYEAARGKIFRHAEYQV